MDSAYFTNLEQSIGLNFAGQKLGSLFGDGTAGTPSIINIVFAAAGFLLLIYLATSGYSYMTAGGDPKKIQSAQAKIMNALLGFFLVFAAYWIVQLVGLIFGINEISGVFG